MEKNNNPVLPLEILISGLFIIIGLTVLGLGLGLYIGEVWASTLIGLGTGLMVNAGIVLRVYLRRA